MKNSEQPAFPLKPYKELAHDYGDNFACYNGIDISGLTKREYFAAMAMQGLLANDWKEQKHLDPECEKLAVVAVNYANALLTALSNEEER